MKPNVALGRALGILQRFSQVSLSSKLFALASHPPYSKDSQSPLSLKFMFSKKATKIDKIFTVYLTLYSRRQINGEDFVNFCGLLRKHEL